MKIKRIKLNHFRRFSDLEIKDIPETTKLVVLAGPNGCGKSSLFDALNLFFTSRTGRGFQNDASYYAKAAEAPNQDLLSRISSVDFHGTSPITKASLYFRSAYRHEPEFIVTSLNRQGAIVDTNAIRRMIDQDASVNQNYQRIASQALESVFTE